MAPDTGVTFPRGFTAAAAAAGIKSGRLDVALVAAGQSCPAAALFTTNRAVAAPVIVSREHLAATGGRARAVIANAGCANAATGAAGIEDARRTARLVAGRLGCDPTEILVASTGVIGVPLPMDRLAAAIPGLVDGLNPGGGPAAAGAILTTDTLPKETGVEFDLPGGRARIGGMAKGAGMIAPNMATLLAFFTTDVAVAPSLLRRALRAAVEASFNRITVDGDTSTNDMAVCLAAGAAALPPIEAPGPACDAFAGALGRAALDLALQIVHDGEGVTRVAMVTVEGAPTAAVADRVARTVAESLLVKTALHGGDPNWGRILAAVGRSGVPVVIDRVDILLGDLLVCAGGAAREYDEALAHAAVTSDPVRLTVRLGAGDAVARIWTTDLSKAYVDINASYRS